MRAEVMLHQHAPVVEEVPTNASQSPKAMESHAVAGSQTAVESTRPHTDAVVIDVLNQREGIAAPTEPARPDKDIFSSEAALEAGCPDALDSAQGDAGEHTAPAEAQPAMAAEHAYGNRDGEEESFECMVCLDRIEQGQMVTYLHCGHVFHSACLHRWFQTKITNGQFGCCPNCNLRIVAPVLQPEKPPQPVQPEQGVHLVRGTSLLLPTFTLCGIQFGNNRKTYLGLAMMWILIMLLVALLRMDFF